jgi:hypothetical protein
MDNPDKIKALEDEIAKLKAELQSTKNILTPLPIKTEQSKPRISYTPTEYNKIMCGISNM